MLVRVRSTVDRPPGGRIECLCRFWLESVVPLKRSSCHCKEVPLEFAREHILETVGHAELESENGQLWIIRLSRPPTECRLLDGWKEFAACNNITRGDALLFKLMSSSKSRKCFFQVKIFKQSVLLDGHENTVPRLHEDKGLKVDKKRLHGAINLDKTTADNLVKLKKEANSSDYDIKSSKEQKRKSSNLNSLNPIDLNSGSDAHAEHDQAGLNASYGRDFKVYEKEKEITATNVSQPSRDSKDKRELKGNHDPITSPRPLNSSENPGHLKVRIIEEAASIGEREANLCSYQQIESSKEPDGDFEKFSIEPTKPKVEQNRNEGKGKLLTGHSIKQPQNDAFKQYSGVKVNFKRKSAVKAMAKIAGVYGVHKSFTSNSEKPCKVSLESSDGVRRATPQVLVSGDPEIGGCKAEQSQCLSGQARRSYERHDTVTSHDILPLSFFKVLPPSAVNDVASLHIPNNISQLIRTALSQPTGPLKFTLMLDSTLYKAKQSGLSKTKQWLVHCVYSYNGAMTLCKGWKEFAVSNDLHSGDTCIFKLIRPFILTVMIFHHADCKIYLKSNVEHFVVSAIPAQPPAETDGVNEQIAII